MKKTKTYFVYIFLFVLSTTVVTSVKAQSARANYNYMDFERKPYYFGSPRDFIFNNTATLIINN